MKKVKTTIAFLVMAIFLTFMIGCSEQTIKLNVEKNLRVNAQKNGISITDMAHLRGGLSIKKHNDGRYELIDNQSSECVYFINNATQFYEAEDPYKNFQFTENSKTIDKKCKKGCKKCKKGHIPFAS